MHSFVNLLDYTLYIGYIQVFYSPYNETEEEKMIDYSPLWNTMKKKGITTYSLLKDYGFSKGTLDSLKQGRNVTLQTIDTLCHILNVPIEKVVRIVNE